MELENTDSTLFSQSVDNLLNSVEEAARASEETVERFIEPFSGTLRRATNRRHHLVFGRRGSGKSSLLRKAFSTLTVQRQPTAYVDLETFKGHSYPDVLISILIESFKKFEGWLDNAAIKPASTIWWDKFFGEKPSRKAVNRKNAALLRQDISAEIKRLEKKLFSAESSTRKEVLSSESEMVSRSKLSGEVASSLFKVSPENEDSYKSIAGSSIEETYTYEKEAYLHRNIQQYRSILMRLAELSESDAFIFLDDLYYIRRSDQAHVVDYFHRIAKKIRRGSK